MTELNVECLITESMRESCDEKERLSKKLLSKHGFKERYQTIKRMFHDDCLRDKLQCNAMLLLYILIKILKN